MNIIIVPNEHEVAQQALYYVTKALKEYEQPVLGLATGHSMEELYALLVKDHQTNQTSWEKVISFNLDEYVGLTPSDPHSYHYFMHHHLFDHVNIQPKNIHIPDTTQDCDVEIIDYKKALIEEGPVSLQLLGLGQNGHIAFNEPMSNFSSDVRVVTLSENTIQNNSRFFDDISQVPKKAITMGILNIVSAEQIVLLASGEAKAKAVQALLEGPIGVVTPATALRTHGNTVIIIDEAAASLLEGKY